MNEKKGFKIRRIAVISAIALAMIFVTGYPMLQLEETVVVDPNTGETEYQRSWKTIWSGSLSDLVRADEASPGAGASGILEVYVHEHEGTPATAYQENNSATLRGDSYADYDADAEGPGHAGYTPHNQFWDLVVRVRVNKTHCWDGVKFMDSYVRVRVSDDGFMGGMSDQEFTCAISGNNSGWTYIYLNFWGQDSGGDAGTGFDLDRDESGEVTAIKLEAYY